MTRALGILALLLMLGAGATAEDAFVIPEGDLPEARVGDYRVAFTRNGAAVVGREGKWVADVGLVYWTKSWENWGTQIRRADSGDRWDPLAEDRLSLVFKGTLFTYQMKPGFSIHQEVKVIPGGLRFQYSLSGEAPADLRGAGVAVQLPVQAAAGATVSMKPEGKTIELLEQRGKVSLGSGPAQELQIGFKSGSVVSVAGVKPFAWSVTDQRQFKNPTFSLFASDKDAVAALTRGETAEIVFDLLLGGEAGPLDNAAPADGAPDPNSKVVVLPDDTETRGDWLDKYGRTAYMLCAMNSPKSPQRSRNPAWSCSIAGGSPKDSARAWKSAAPAEDDRTVLWAPDRSRRVPASIDDHGEAYELGAGPDLHLRCAVPGGKHQLSLYFFETDWIQYRAYDISVFTDDARDRLLAKTSVSDFFKGKYKRFAVEGPAKLHFVLSRGNSTNVVISGIFLDPLE